MRDSEKPSTISNFQAEGAFSSRIFCDFPISDGMTHVALEVCSYCFRPDSGEPRHGRDPRHAHRALLRRLGRDRRVLRCLQASEHAAPPFCGGSLPAGLRSDARRREGEKRGRGGHLHRPRLHRARAFGLRREHPRRRGGAAARLGDRERSCVGPRGLRPRERAHPLHVPLHRLHGAHGACRFRPQHLEALCGAGGDARSPQPLLHRLHGASRASHGRAHLGACRGGDPGRRTAARHPVSGALQARDPGASPRASGQSGRR